MSSSEKSFERLLLDPKDYDLNGSDIPLESKEQAIALIKAVIQGDNSKLFPAAILNGGFYLWRFKQASSLESAFELAEKILSTGEVAAKLTQLQMGAKTASHI